LNRSNVRLEVIGQIHRLPEFVQKQLKKNAGGAFAQQRPDAHHGAELRRPDGNCGCRTEHCGQGEEGRARPGEITEEVVADHLYTRKWPDPDVLIPHQRRNARQQFSSVADFLCRTDVTPTLWPDFRKPQLYAALEEYNRRHRRFGGL